MNPRPNRDRSPFFGTWLLGLFASSEDRDQIAGDLAEEFLEKSARSGANAARRWYWRQILKSLPHLFASSLRDSPWRIAVAVALGIALRRSLGRLPELAIFTLVERYRIYDNHFGVYQFLASTGIDLGQLVTFFLVGSVVALIARKRELAPALLLGLAYAGLAVGTCIFIVAKTGDLSFCLRLPWYLADACAIFLGAVAVRSLQAARQARRPAGI